MDAVSIKLAGITTLKIGVDDLRTSLSPTGEVAATDSGVVQVTSRLPGKIVEARVAVGDRVHKGDVVAIIDSVDLATAQAAYLTDLAHEQLTKHQLEQEKKLASYGSLSEQPEEDARKASVAADAAVASDEAQIKVDRLALVSARQLIEMGEITRKPVEDAQNAFSQAQSAASQAASSVHATKSSYDRAVILFNGGVYSRQQLEDAENAYNSARASDLQAKTAEKLARQELTRQEAIFNRNLNGAAALQGAQSKVTQDEHTYQTDLVGQELAHRQYERAQRVRKSGISISQALQAAQDSYDEAEIAVESAATALRLYGVDPSSKSVLNGRALVSVVSPVDGLVAARTMVVGQNVDTTVMLARIVNLDKVFIEAQIYEKDVAGVAIGDSVQVHVSAMPGKMYLAKVQYVAREVSQDTRTILVRSILENPGWTLRPGMFASIAIGGAAASHVLNVPTEALLQEGDHQVVYVLVAPGQFVKRVVRTQPPIGAKAPVVEGLQAGDEVVSAGSVFILKAQEQLESGKRG